MLASPIEITQTERQAVLRGADALTRRAAMLRRFAFDYSDPDGIVRGAEEDGEAAKVLYQLVRDTERP